MDEKPRSSVPLFSARDTTLIRVALIAVVLFAGGSGFLGAAYYRSAYWNRIGFAPAQPVPFSHRHHAGELRIDCRNCHTTVETSAFAGLPPTQTCLSCHSQLFTDTTLLRPVIQSARENVPLQWSRVTRLPDHVYFNHSIHVNKGVACATCHGDVGQMALTAKAEPLTMRWCIDCHRDPGPRLSPSSEVFASLAPAVQHEEPPEKLLAVNHIQAGNLRNCSTCHH